MEVLIDREAVQDGAVASRTPWQYFDLGHGICADSFVEQCPHRMACARCDFSLPKDSTRAQLLEARGNLQRMLAQMPLTHDERAAVEDGASAVERLIEDLPETDNRKVFSAHQSATGSAKENLSVYGGASSRFGLVTIASSVRRER